MTSLFRMGCLIPNKHAPWQAALRVALKDLSTMLRLIFDLRPVNGPTKQDSLSMQKIELELGDFSGSNHLAPLDFCAGCWRSFLDPSLYYAGRK